MKDHWICEYDDETSMFDPQGRWVGGSEYYAKTYRVYVPNTISEDDEDVITDHIERVVDKPEYWL